MVKMTTWSGIDEVLNIKFDFVYIAALDPILVQEATKKLISLDVSEKKIINIKFDRELIKQNISNMGFCSDTYRSTFD